jgi:hypothetical protein
MLERSQLFRDWLYGQRLASGYKSKPSLHVYRDRGNELGDMFRFWLWLQLRSNRDGM